MVPDAAPAPRADLAALLAAGAARIQHAGLPPPGSLPQRRRRRCPLSRPRRMHADEALPAGVTSLAERRGRKRRLAIVGGAVVGAMTLGAGAVAASSEDFRKVSTTRSGVIFQPPARHPTWPRSTPAVAVPTSRRLPRRRRRVRRHHARPRQMPSGQAPESAPERSARSPAPPHRPPSAATESFRHRRIVRSRRGSPDSPARRRRNAARIFPRIRGRTPTLPGVFPPDPRPAIGRLRNPVALSLRAVLSAQNDPSDSATWFARVGGRA